MTHKSKRLVALLLALMLAMTFFAASAFAAGGGLSNDRNGTRYDYVIGYMYSGSQQSINTREIFTAPDNYAIWLCPVCGKGDNNPNHVGTALASNLYMPCYAYDVAATGGDGYIRYAWVRHRHNDGTLSNDRVYIPINVPMYSGCYYGYDTTPPSGPSISAPTGWQYSSATVQFSGGSDTGTSLPDWTATPGDYGSGINHYEYQINGGAWTGCPVGDPSVVITAGGTTTVTARAVDGAGNASEQTASVQVYIDTVAPNAPTVSPSTTSWTNQNMPVSIKDNGDTYSGVARTEYALDGGSWTAGTSLTISAHGKHTVSGRVVDNVGRISSTTSKTVLVDKVAPIVSSVSQTPNSGHTMMTLAVSATDADSGVQGYAVTSSRTAPSASAFSNASPTVSANGTYYVWARDHAGNISTAKEIRVTALDIVPPVVTKVETQRTWDAQSNWAKVTATDDNSGVVAIGWATSASGSISWMDATSTATFTFRDNSTYYAFAKDLAGNISDPAEFTIDRIDKHSPIIDDVTWDKQWSQSKTITVTAHDMESGLGQYAMTKTTERPTEWQDGNVFADITENGTYYLWAKDNVGRVSADPNADSSGEGGEPDPGPGPEEIIIDTIDRSKPVMDAIIHSSTDNAPEGVFAYPCFNVVDRPTLEAHDIADKGWTDSGIKEIQYQFVADGAELTEDWFTYDEANKPAMKDEFFGKIVGRAIDNAGNISDPLDAQFLFETTPPTATHTLTPDVWTNTDVEIDMTAQDAFSGLRHIVLPNGEIVEKATVKFSVAENAIYPFVARDYCGNELSYLVDVQNIDKVAPVVDWYFVPLDEAGRTLITDYGSTEYYNCNLTLQAFGEDDSSGLKSYEYHVDNGPWKVFDPATPPSFTTEQIGTVGVRVWDIAGNVSKEVTRDFVLDKTAPILTHTLDPDEKTEGKVTINIGANGDICGVESIVKPDGTVVYAVPGTEFVVSENGRYLFVCWDRCGNRTDYWVTVDNIISTAKPIVLEPDCERPEPPAPDKPDTPAPLPAPAPVPAKDTRALTLLDLFATLAVLGLAIAACLKRKNKGETTEDEQDGGAEEAENAEDDEQKPEKRRRYLLLHWLLALASVVLFFVTQPLVWRFRWIDWWTLLFVLLLIAAVVLFVLGRRESAKKETAEDFEENESEDVL